MPTSNQISDVLIAYAKNAPVVYGAQLGSVIKKAFPDFDIRKEYGGIGQFIQKECGDKILRIGKHGTDDVYTLIRPESGSKNVPTERYPSPEIAPWKVFANPSKKAKLIVDVKNGLVTTIHEDEKVPEGYVVIPKLTDEDHKSFAREFLPFVDNTDRVSLSTLLSRDNFWPQWSTEIVAVADGKYRNQWLAFRFAKITNSLEMRLRQTGIASGLVEEVLRKIKNTKESPSSSSFKPETPMPQNVRMTRHSSKDSSARQIAHRAVDLMTEDELRKLWLPLGAVLDALPS